MTLWNIIRDWFVEYVWGGVLSNGIHVNSNIIGNITAYENGTVDDTFLASTSEGGFVILHMVGYSEKGGFISLGDWLSTTSTIIVLVLMCAFLFLVVRYLFRLTSGLIRGH